MAIKKNILKLNVFRDHTSRIQAGKWASYALVAIGAVVLFAVTLFLTGLGSGDKVIEGIKQTAPAVIFFFMYTLLLLVSYNRPSKWAQTYFWFSVCLLCLSKYGGFFALALSAGQLAWSDQRQGNESLKNHSNGKQGSTHQAEPAESSEDNVVVDIKGKSDVSTQQIASELDALENNNNQG